MPGAFGSRPLAHHRWEARWLLPMGVSGPGWKSSRLHSGSSLVSPGLSEKVISASLSVAVSSWLPLSGIRVHRIGFVRLCLRDLTKQGRRWCSSALPGRPATTGGSSRLAQRPVNEGAFVFGSSVLSAPARRPCSPAMRNRCVDGANGAGGQIRIRPALRRARGTAHECACTGASSARLSPIYHRTLG